MELTPTPVPLSAETEAELAIQARIVEAVTRNEAVILNVTKSDIYSKVRSALVTVMSSEVEDGDLDNEVAKRIFNAVKEALGLDVESWVNPFQTRYNVVVRLDYDIVLEVEVEADDEVEAQDEVEQNLEFDDLVITGVIRYTNGYEESDFSTDLSSYDYDIDSRLSFRVSEVD